jgi:hypothetical protein
MRNKNLNFGFVLFLLLLVAIEAIAAAFVWYIMIILLSMPTLLWNKKWFLFVLSYGVYVSGIGGILHILFQMESIVKSARYAYESYLQDLQAIGEGYYRRRRPPFWQYIWQGIQEAKEFPKKTKEQENNEEINCHLSEQDR